MASLAALQLGVPFMKVHVLSHSPDSPPGTVLEWAENKGHEVVLVNLFEGHALPELSEVSLLVILGGRMNVDDVSEHPWLQDEKGFLRKAIDRHIPCLGLCLGGQLLAQVLGAQVRKHDHWEVGWHPVIVGTDQRLTVFQFHQDTFDLPQGATRVATNRITENQAFAYGDSVVGLQFHPEATEDWVRKCAEMPNYPEGPHVQKPEHMLEDLVLLTPMKRWFFGLLDRMESIAHSAQKEKSN